MKSIKLDNFKDMVAILNCVGVFSSLYQPDSGENSLILEVRK